MSIELPKGHSSQGRWTKNSRGKRIGSCSLKDFERLKRIGLLNKDIREFDRLVNGR